jgi:hypothetical protein
MGKAAITCTAMEDGDGDPEIMRRWFLENELRAREAMLEAGIWYGAGPPEALPAPSAGLLDRVLAAVAGVTSIGEEDIRGASRQAHFAAARNVAFFILRNHCGLGHRRIAESFGCHHSAVIGACHRVEANRADFECWIGPALARIAGRQP